MFVLLVSGSIVCRLVFWGGAFDGHAEAHREEAQREAAAGPPEMGDGRWGEPPEGGSTKGGEAGSRHSLGVNGTKRWRAGGVLRTEVRAPGIAFWRMRLRGAMLRDECGEGFG